MTRSKFAVALVTFGLTVLGAHAPAHALTTTRFDLEATNTNCLPDASARATVLHHEDELGVDTLQLRVRGLPPFTSFTVFLTEADAFTSPPFGAVAYIGELTTNAAGAGSLRVDAIIAEFFVSKREGDPPTRVRVDLDNVVLWFADPAEVPACFNFSGSTPFDGDGEAGPAALSSREPTGLEVLP
jgi:hypothetical protein